MYEDETEMSPTKRGGGLGHAVKNLFLLILFVALAFGLLYLVADRNARRYFLVPEGGNLVVKRGIFFPIGEKPYLPDDPGLAAAYAPIPLPPSGFKSGPKAFDERSDLDRTLFDQLLDWAKTRIHSGDTKTLEKGIYYLRRAEKLPTYTEAQRTSLDELQGEVAYYEAKRKLADAVKSLENVADKLRQARDSGSARANESEALLTAIQDHVAALREILEQLKKTGSLPMPTGGPGPAAGTRAPPPASPAATGGAEGAGTTEPRREAPAPAPARTRADRGAPAVDAGSHPAAPRRARRHRAAPPPPAPPAGTRTAAPAPARAPASAPGGN